MRRLSDSEIESNLKSLKGGERRGEVLEKTYRFPTFKEAIDVIASVAGVAQVSRHHPDIQNSWRASVLNLTTHDAGGSTEKDLEVAGRMDALSP